MNWHRMYIVNTNNARSYTSKISFIVIPEAAVDVDDDDDDDAGFDGVVVDDDDEDDIAASVCRRLKQQKLVGRDGRAREQDITLNHCDKSRYAGGMVVVVHVRISVLLCCGIFQHTGVPACQTWPGRRRRHPKVVVPVLREFE
mmetsp:Transcript_41852/g.100468  ORF Transcript_41852/g.100468 Transcript_41852/m.100468 type:complete len:143 (-) Transcript_41852:235-663(-)